MAITIKEHWQNYIDGVWCESSTNDRIPVENPATGQVFATIARGTADDIDRAVAAAIADADRERLLSANSHAHPPALRLRKTILSM